GADPLSTFLAPQADGAARGTRTPSREFDLVSRFSEERAGRWAPMNEREELPRGIMRRADGQLFVRVWQHGRERPFPGTTVKQGERLRHKLKTEIHEKRFFPERYHRRDVLLKDYLPTYIETYVDGHQRDRSHPKQYVGRWTAALGTKALRAITPDDIQKH